MVDDNSEHVAHAWRKICLVLENDCTCSIQMPEANQITEIAPYAHVHTIFLETLVPWIRLWYYGKWIAFSITEPFLCVIDAVKDTDLNHTGRHFYYSLHQDGSALPHHGLTLGVADPDPTPWLETCFGYGPGTYWVPQKLPQIYTVIAYICIGKVAWFAVYICGNYETPCIPLSLLLFLPV